MGLSRQELNLRRLLIKCELMCKTQKDDERFPKYIESLEDMFQEVKKLTGSKFLSSYQSRIASIKSELGMLTDYSNENEVGAMRNELLGLKKRNIIKTAEQLVDAKDLDQVLNYHEETQKKITDDMLILAKNLKEQSELANKIIKKDTEVVMRSMQLTDQNHTKLSSESQKLKEHSRMACKCWMWVMLALVMIIFINMVLFMKVMKKK